MSAVVQSEVENILFIKPHCLKHKEMLNGLIQMKRDNRVQQSNWSKQR